ncbi:MBOAT, membrane-bound O-acyltransferase family-domain-containing protein [Melampsora americana]|nr:MBOAT, membrane-bound O-acyltransferase family-domain-containing protein [Melampsora americana]
MTGAAALILIALHGTSVFKILIIVTINYHLARRAPSPLIWVFNVGVLFANDYWDGYRYRHFLPFLSFLDQGKYRRLIPRWQIGFNISMLRLISYSFDYQWAAAAKAKAAITPKDTTPPNTTVEKSEENDRLRTDSPRELSEYGFINYFNYIFYPPLYIAGPIITFNNFTSQIARSRSNITPRMIIGYSIRFLVCFLTMEFVLHYMYVIAIKDARAWEGDSPFELSMIGSWNLIAVWLKLLIPWRFRLWALIDGVDPPENMVRCMANNYSTLAFWRSWHRSYNLWTVRLVYTSLPTMTIRIGED